VIDSFIQMVQRYAGLVRFSHTIFALPFALASMLWAAGGWPRWQVFAGIMICMVTARNAAMAFNRLVDADVDAQNPRTQGRHIPAGILKPSQVKVFILINSLLFVFAAFWLNLLAGALAIPVLLVLFSYSLWKRFHWGSHLFLGLAIGLSPVGAWVAVSGTIGQPALFLMLVLWTWIAGFDIIYATADQDSDLKTGLKSIPVQFGIRGSMAIAAALHFLSLSFLVSLIWLFSPGILWWGGAALIGAAMIWIHGFRRSNSLDQVNADFFLLNGFISLNIFLLALLSFA